MPYAIQTQDKAGSSKVRVADDPFTKAGLFEKVTITRWRKAFFNMERLI
jgi:uncharacterized protein YciI